MDVVGIDTPCLDFLTHIEKLPKSDHGTSLLEYSWQGGGKVSSALVALARLGAKCGIIGYVGSDVYGRFCIKDFNDHGIDTTYLKIDEDKDTPFSLVLSEKQTKGRNIIYHSGNARRLSPNELNKDYITSAKYLHLSQVNDATYTAAKWAREGDVKVVFDADSYNPKIDEMIPLIDVFIASEFYYASRFNNDENFQKNCTDIMSMGPEIVVFTLGSRGCVGMDKHTFFTQPAFNVDVVDTVGAGDVYHGAFIFGLLNGWDVSYTALFANAVSAIKCTRIGGRAAIPDLETVCRFMETGRIDYTEIDKRVAYYRSEAIWNIK